MSIVCKNLSCVFNDRHREIYGYGFCTREDITIDKTGRCEHDQHR